MPFFCIVSIRLDRYAPKTWCVFRLCDRYIPKNVSHFAYSSSLNWYSVWRMQYAPTLTAEKCGAFGDSYTYPAYFPGLGRGLDFLLPSFLVSRQGPYRGREVFLGTFSRSIMYPVNFLGLGRGLDFLLPSFLVSRQEKKVGEWGQSPRFS